LISAGYGSQNEATDGNPHPLEVDSAMPIKVKCSSCGAAFSAKDNLAGKRVKCPKCSAVLQIPDRQATSNPQPASVGAATSPSRDAAGGQRGGRRAAGTVLGNLGDPLAELLDEVGVKGAVTGPSCPSCEAPITPGARLCINCGFNFETGQHLQTVAFDDEDENAGMSETEKLLSKAEREIDDMPISGVDQDFGDGASAYVMAGAAALVAVTLTAVGLMLVISLRYMGSTQGPATMAAVAASVFVLIAHVWMIIAAFLNEPRMGVMCVFIPGFSFVYACMHRIWFAVFMMVMGGLVLAGALAVMSAG